MLVCGKALMGPLAHFMMQGSKAHFAELAPANVGLGPAKHEQAAPREGPTKWDGSLEAKRRAYSEECKAFLLK